MITKSKHGEYYGKSNCDWLLGLGNMGGSIAERLLAPDICL